MLRGERLDCGEWGPLPGTGENGFLIFKRKSGQSFDLMPAHDTDLERTTLAEFLAGGAIGICVLGIKEGMVSYGICAPPAVKILRDDAIDRVGHQSVANWV